MIENGIVGLINADPGVLAALAGGVGGFGFDELAKNLPLPSWAFRFFGGHVIPTLGGVGPKSFRWRRMEIHCMGSSADNTLTLAGAIDNVLSGFSGMLPDASPGGTQVDSIIPSNSPIDFFDSAARSWRRVLEYQVWFRPS